MKRVVARERELLLAKMPYYKQKHHYKTNNMGHSVYNKDHAYMHICMYIVAFVSYYEFPKLNQFGIVFKNHQDVFNQLHCYLMKYYYLFYK